ncbi:DUF1758 domain-containing protein [Trichonephila clavipes]|nr:DUF1758 domain-containing protein [Trichonephila clavipes]
MRVLNACHPTAVLKGVPFEIVLCGKPHNKLIHFPKEPKNVSSGGEKRSFPDHPEVVNKSHPGGECSWSVPPQVGCQGFVSTNRVENKKNVILSTDSVFGYIVGGSVEDEPNLYACGLICGSEELNSNLRKFWEIEEIDNELPKNLENSICEEHYAQTHKRDESGKYIVSIPFKEHWSCLGNSKDIALETRIAVDSLV